MYTQTLVEQAREAYATDRLDLAGLETELDYVFGLKTRPVKPMNMTQVFTRKLLLEQSLFYGAKTEWMEDTRG